MDTCGILVVLFAFTLSNVNCQHPPGVNPQIYQQQPQMSPQQAQQMAAQQAQQLAMQQQQQQFAMQQQQQMAMQQQQMAMHQQQMGIQPQQMGMQPQQVGMQPQQMGVQQPNPHSNQAQVAHGGHPPPPPASPQQVFNAQQLEHERDHIGEHVGVPVDTSNMSEQELQFHYFKMHDADNNNKLDGCELVKSLIHWHDQANHDPKSGAPMPDPKIFNDAELVAMIDPILAQDDKNKDGFIDYPEFIQAQQASGAVH